MSQFERLSREEYLERAPVTRYVNYLVGLLAGSPVDHACEVVDRRWRSHIAPGRPKTETVTVRFRDLEDARLKYFWVASDEPAEVEGDAPEPDDSSLAANTRLLDALSTGMRSAIAAGNEDRAFLAAMRILDWGKVWRGATGWLIRHRQQEQLVERIRAATSILCGDDHQGLDRFDDDDLRLDSGLTKVFSLASLDLSIIYDDRVAAALGLCVGKCFGLADGVSQAPAELRFATGGSKTRNPNLIYPGARFESKQHGRGGRRWAKWNLRANWILSKALERHRQGNPGNHTWNGIRSIEAALFMIGYRIKD